MSSRRKNPGQVIFNPSLFSSRFIRLWSPIAACTQDKANKSTNAIRHLKIKMMAWMEYRSTTTDGLLKSIKMSQEKSVIV
jgi:hypothetical protein